MGLGLSLIISVVTMAIYCKLFMKAGENPIFAFIPVLNFYTLCGIVDAMWAFWTYIVGFICYVCAYATGMPEAAFICILAILIVNIVVYVRLLLSNMDDFVWVVILIVLELAEAFFG